MFDKIKAKPKYVRKQYALWTSAGITSVILIIWGVSLKYNLDNFTPTFSQISTEAENKNNKGFNNVIDEVKSNVANVIDSLATSTFKVEDKSQSKEATSTPIRVQSNPNTSTSTASSSVKLNKPKKDTTATSSKYRFIRVKGSSSSPETTNQ